VATAATLGRFEADGAQQARAHTADDISQTLFLDNNEQYGLARPEVEAFQLRAAQRRFEELLPRLPALRDQASRYEVTRIGTLDDIVPLLFSHAVYKSYPMAILENRRFDLLTRWLQRSTTADISSVDVSACKGIDEWMDTLERATDVQVYHTSGTSGKLSFLARTKLERDLWNIAYIKRFEPFGTEPGVVLGGKAGERLPVVYPSVRYGRYMAQRQLQFFSETVTPTPEECYTLSNGTLSADLIALAGRVRIAQAKGEVSRMKLAESERIALQRYIEEQERRPQEMARFFDAMIEKLQGRRVLLFSQTSYLVQAARAGLKRGLRNALGPGSIVQCGGGGKGVVLPDDWESLIREFTGVEQIHQGYGMTELTGSMALCPHNHYHIQRFIVPFILTPDGRSALPRTGRQTGRFAALDLAAQHLWGGLVTGDQLTIEWDEPCACGRKGAYILNQIGRIDESISGDDKVSCAATIDNTDAALHTLLAS
jgi:hypothetical protein